MCRADGVPTRRRTGHNSRSGCSRRGLAVVGFCVPLRPKLAPTGWRHGASLIARCRWRRGENGRRRGRAAAVMLAWYASFIDGFIPSEPEEGRPAVLESHVWGS
eukprot:scaffold4747_cov99-Isochrysis_galbana.AAC.9